MKPHQNDVFALASLSLGLLVAAPTRAASLTEVPVADWKGSISPPSYVKMYIYVPDTKAAKPPIMVSAHSCGSTASGQMDNIKKIKAAADSKGFILILPDNPGQNCWDAGSDKALKHDGGSDTQAIAQMVKYTLSKYSGDASRVYMMGGSSGGIMTQAMLGVYPDIFRAGSARAGVPAGCWGVRYDLDGTRQWSVPCADGTVTHTPKEWGDMVRAMYPGYTGHRPRVQLIQGETDTTIHYVANFAESIDEWTDVLGLSATPTSTEKGYQGLVASYNRQFWKDTCGSIVLETWSAPGKDHSMGYEEDGILKFFGLDAASTTDPEADCSGDAGVGGAGGAGSTGGASSAGGTKAAGGASSNAGGTKATGGASSTSVIGSTAGGTLATGGAFGNAGGTRATGGASSTSVISSTAGGTKATGGASSNAGGTKAAGGASSNTGGTKALGGNTSVSTGGGDATGGSTGSVATASSGGSSGNTASATTSAAASVGGTSALAAGGASAVGNSTVTNTASSTQDAGGCGCRVVSARGPGGSFAALLLGLLGAGLSRRRRPRA